MKLGDLVRIVRPNLLLGIELGDLAILAKVDWDHRDYPNGIISRSGERITGRGYFFFPGRPAVHAKLQCDGRPIGVIPLFNDFEVISDD